MTELETPSIGIIKMAGCNTGLRHNYASLCSSTDETLEEVLRNGVMPKFDDVMGYEYRGWNTPFFASWVGILRFKKGFFWDTGAGGRPRGYNKNIEPGKITELWQEKGPGGKSAPFGFYEIQPQLEVAGSPYPNSILLDYNCPRNLAVDPTKLLRDYVVQVHAGDPTLLLGKAYLALPGDPAISFFILERVGESVVPA